MGGEGEGEGEGIVGGRRRFAGHTVYVCLGCDRNMMKYGLVSLDGKGFCVVKECLRSFRNGIAS